MSKQHNKSEETEEMMESSDSATEEVNEKESSNQYKPAKNDREARNRVWRRYNDMLADTLRTDAEADWEQADKDFRQWTPPREPDDWRADLILPDAFAAIQAQMQETIERKSRPNLQRVQDDDDGMERFANAIMKYNMDRTDFDYQYFLAKYSAASRGTSFLMDFYRVDKRKIKDPTSVDKEGNLVYTEKEVIDYDDDYTMWVPNEYIYVDPDARDVDAAQDMFYREVMEVEEWKRRYEFHKDYSNVDKVRPSSETVNKAFFRQPKDLNENQVEALHYYNRSTDEYIVLCNNIIVRNGPLPTKHKELPIAVVYHYRIPGYFWGMGIPKVINALTQERRSIRNLRIDRQKMQQGKMFLKNAATGDLTEDDTVTRPFGIIEVETNGRPLSEAMQPLEYGDVPASSYKEEEMLLEDIRRAHGIDDRIQGVQVGGTATEAAILKESSQKRINLITALSEMDTLKRIGKIKWSNIQFFYPAPRVEKVFEENREKEQKVYKTVTLEGQSFDMVQGEKGPELKFNDISGKSTFKLDKKMARFMEGDYDIVITSVPSSEISKPIKQAKVVELLTLLSGNPMWLAQLDPKKSEQRIFQIFEEDPGDWLKNDGISVQDMQILADQENMLMGSGNILGPTPNATEEHTLVHINFAESAMFQELPPEYQQIITNHILAEHDANPATGSAAELLGGPEDPAGGAPGANPDTVQQGMPQQPGVGMTPSTVTGEEPNSSQNGNAGPR